MVGQKFSPIKSEDFFLVTYNLLLSFVNQDKVKELLDKARNSKNINDFYDCFMICKDADADENGFKDWKLKSESVSLKLNAEAEIINFYKEKIKELY